MKRSRTGREVIRGLGRGLVVACWLVLAAAEWLASPSCRSGVAGRARWLSRLCGRLANAMGVKVETRGERPAEGTLLAANHVSYLDIVVLAATGPVVFVAKREVHGWPVAGWAAARAGTCFIDRGRTRDAERAGAEIGAVLAAGVSVVVFFEGTSTDGRGVGPFKPALLEEAIARSWPVAATGIDYAAAPGRKVETEIAWWGEMTLMPHLWNMLTMSEVRARVVWGTKRVARGERKSLADALRAEVVELRREVWSARSERGAG